MRREQIIKSIKIAVAAILAIGVASVLELKFQSTAGIITILSIQNTKRETLKSARNRGLAFLCAIVLSVFLFSLLGFNLFAFGLYLLIFCLICLRFSWVEAIAMDSVLITHLLTEESYSMSIVMNESLLFMIGTGMGVLVNMYLRKQGNYYETLAEEVDGNMKNVLQKIYLQLLEDDTQEYDEGCLMKLEKSLDIAKECAIENLNNSLLSQDTYELEYVQMREQQSRILREIYMNIKRITYLPTQASTIVRLMQEIEQGYHKHNAVEGLLEKLEAFYLELKDEPLPSVRDEFEARAILFYILIELRKLLEIKREFILNQI
ncbi:MAG: aromatic acid exporter family protein [Eubacteriales bacterium]